LRADFSNAAVFSSFFFQHIGFVFPLTTVPDPQSFLPSLLLPFFFFLCFFLFLSFFFSLHRFSFLLQTEVCGYFHWLFSSPIFVFSRSNPSPLK